MRQRISPRGVQRNGPRQQLDGVRLVGVRSRAQLGERLQERVLRFGVQLA
jgi:hypothetical protein